jgi:hypothetical protein
VPPRPPPTWVTSPPQQVSPTAVLQGQRARSRGSPPAWLNRFRRLIVRYERRADILSGLPLPRLQSQLVEGLPAAVLQHVRSDVLPEEQILPDFSTPWPWDFDSFVVALSIIQQNREVAEQGLEELFAT